MFTTSQKLIMCSVLSLCLNNCGDEETTQPPQDTSPIETNTPAADTSSIPPAPTPEPEPAPEPTPEERYNNGAGAPVDPVEAIGWFTEFSELGVVDATYRLGMSYYAARALPMNFVKAVEYLRQAAEKGHREAAIKLAECYEWGVGVPADATEAAKWRPEDVPPSEPIGESISSPESTPAPEPIPNPETVSPGEESTPEPTGTTGENPAP